MTEPTPPEPLPPEPLPTEPPDDAAQPPVDERRRRWRLLLGEAAEEALDAGLGGDDVGMDRVLGELYDAEPVPAGRPPAQREGGLGSSAPGMVRWLGDIRSYFPTSVVQVMQRDAIDRLQLTSLLLEPELLDSVQPDVQLAGTLLSLAPAMPETTRRTARLVVDRVVGEIERRVATRTVSAVHGALGRSRTRRPRPSDVDWPATIAANLRHYLPEQRTVVPERLVGRSRVGRAVARHVVVALDQSGSMAESLVHGAVFAATLASVRSVRTSLVAFDSEVVDLSDRLHDPVEVLFGCQLGGGTDINRAVAYCQGLVTAPEDTLLVLISDLFEGGLRDDLLRRVHRLVADGVTVVVLLALSDQGAPAYDHENAAALAALGVPVFGCTPEEFPDLLEVALARGDVGLWAARTAGRRAAPRGVGNVSTPG